MRSIKRFLKNIIVVTIPSCLLLFLLCEAFFRVIIPAAEFPHAYYDINDKILKWDHSKNTEGNYTIGVLAKKRIRWRINNDGWNSDIDYFSKRSEKPLIAIIGDSYIEAFHVSPEDNIAAQLRNKIQKYYDVYSFGISGASLAQYLQMARYIDKYFEPDILVFNVVHNDFQESLCSMRYKLGTLCLEEQQSGLSEAKIMPYRANRFKRIIRKSSVIRYIWVNMKIKGIYSELVGMIEGNEKNYNANVNVNLLTKDHGKISKVIDYCLLTLKKTNPKKEIIFIIDAPRNDIYLNNVMNSDIIWLNKLLSLKSNEYGFNFIDLTENFSHLYDLNKKRFEFTDDFHWNEYAHKTAADVLYQKLCDSEIIKCETFSSRTKLQ